MSSCLLKMGGSLTDEELAEIKAHNVKYFVESGTYKAETTLLVAPHFEHVYTVEIHEGLYEAAVERCKDVENITLVKGDSIKELGPITAKVTEGAVIFLDAHISGCDSGWNQINRVPIFQELDVILPNKLGPSVFIFDDLRFWTTQKAWDWAEISNMGILKKFKDHGYKIKMFYERNDRFWVFTG